MISYKHNFIKLFNRNRTASRALIDNVFVKALYGHKSLKRYNMYRKLYSKLNNIQR